MNFRQTHIAGLRFSINNNSFANLSYSFLKDQSDSYLYDSVDDISRSGTLDSRYVGREFDSQQGVHLHLIWEVISKF